MSITSGARPDLESYDQATRLPADELVSQLRQLLGARLLAGVAGVKQTRTIHDWAEGRREIRAEGIAARLRLTYQVARMIAAVDSAEILQAWMQGLNPELDDRSPARLLRDGDLETDGAQVLAAARSFVAHG